MNASCPQKNRFSASSLRLRRKAAALLGALLVGLPLASTAGIFVSVDIAPPALPVYSQPPMPGDGYIWTPGYWAYSDDGYFWVPGTWVLAPYRGALWTPGYWAWGGDGYAFHEGYWADHVGFYGGVDYGYGYTGEGYEGGYWNGGRIYYNRTVNNIHVTNVNVYNTTVIHRTTINHISYLGGPGGLTARPTPRDLQAEHERHVRPLPLQQRQVAMASHEKALFVSTNHGAPPIAATPEPGRFAGSGVVRSSAPDARARMLAEHAERAVPARGGPVATGLRRGPHDGPQVLGSAHFAPEPEHARETLSGRPRPTVAYSRRQAADAPTALRSAGFAPRTDTGMTRSAVGHEALERRTSPSPSPHWANRDAAPNELRRAEDRVPYPSRYETRPTQLGAAAGTSPSAIHCTTCPRKPGMAPCPAPARLLSPNARTCANDAPRASACQAGATRG